MFAPYSALLQTQTIAPVSRPYRASKRVRIHELSAEFLSSQNTLRWFSRSRLCSSLLLNRTEVERALSYTPTFREELTVQNSCAWPATFDSKHIGLIGSSCLRRNTIEGIARGKVISRGFKTKASAAREALANKEPPVPADEDVGGSPGRILSGKRFSEIFDDKNITQEEKMRLTYAFAEGFRASEGREKKSANFWQGLLKILWSFPTAVIIYLAYLVYTRGIPMLGGPNEISPEDIEVTFEDVMGVEEAKQELQEIVEFLKDPKKFSHLGGRLPKGALLVGPPGTGKTLLARAVAGEAGVPFFHASGSEFDEMFVGQGARRMRDLFNNAKARAPCVIFIDEIDSVGGKRSSSSLHPYANQTINQLLSEMDGFHQNEGVIVLGATNRRDHLDKALLRPGRFDVEVEVPKPDISGRKSLLEYYVSKVKIDEDIDISYLARGTTGFTGADIENMVNQAALKSAVDGKDSVTQAYLLNARDKILMGPELKSRIPDHEDNLITAYHEGGHALVSYYSKDAMPLHKVTIIRRGPALGHTAYIPAKDEIYQTKSQMLAQMDTMMGGRAAEELKFGAEKVTTGAHSDLKKATDLASRMVKFYGMSEKVGERFFDPDPNSETISNQTSELIDQEIKKTLHEAMERAKQILRTHERELKLLADALLEYETLDAAEVKQLLETGTLGR